MSLNASSFVPVRGFFPSNGTGSGNDNSAGGPGSQGASDMGHSASDQGFDADFGGYKNPYSESLDFEKE